MSSRQELTERIRRGDPLPPGLGPLLQAFTPITRFGMWWRLRQPAVKIDAHVISFGNITAGGAGKTPAVIARAQEELAAGRRVAVLSRGYGSAKVQEPYACDRIDDLAATARLIGDEPALILRYAPGVVLVKAADRVAGARHALDAFGCDTVILDDGYQHVRLARDENIVLIDASNPFGSGHLVPRGMLREPLRALNRATEILLTRCDQAADLLALEARLHEYRPDLTPKHSRHAPRRIWRVATGETLPLDWLNGREVYACCSIAQPGDFFRSLEKLGAHLVSRRAFPDHQPIPLDALPTDSPVLVTEKDAVRMARPPAGVYALGIALEAC